MVKCADVLASVSSLHGREDLGLVLYEKTTCCKPSLKERAPLNEGTTSLKRPLPAGEEAVGREAAGEEASLAKVAKLSSVSCIKTRCVVQVEPDDVIMKVKRLRCNAAALVSDLNDIV